MRNNTIYDGYPTEEEYRKNLIQKIKETDYNELRVICCELEFALSPYDLIRLANAYKTGEADLKEKIEDILEDVNFHHENGLLISGKADQVIEENKEQIERYIEIELTNKFWKAYLKTPKEKGMLPANSSILKDFSIIDIYYLVDRGILQKRECVGLAFELTDDYINKNTQLMNKEDRELELE